MPRQRVCVGIRDRRGSRGIRSSRWSAHVCTALPSEPTVPWQGSWNAAESYAWSQASAGSHPVDCRARTIADDWPRASLASRLSARARRAVRIAAAARPAAGQSVSNVEAAVLVRVRVAAARSSVAPRCRAWRTPLTLPWAALLVAMAVASAASPVSRVNALHMTGRVAAALRRVSCSRSNGVTTPRDCGRRSGCGGRRRRRGQRARDPRVPRRRGRCCAWLDGVPAVRRDRRRAGRAPAGLFSTRRSRRCISRSSSRSASG